MAQDGKSHPWELQPPASIIPLTQKHILSLLPFFSINVVSLSLSLFIKLVSLPLLALTLSFSLSHVSLSLSLSLFFPPVHTLIQGRTHSQFHSTVSPTLYPSLLPPTPGGQGPSQSSHFFTELRTAWIKRVFSFTRSRHKPHLSEKNTTDNNINN